MPKKQKLNLIKTWLAEKLDVEFLTVNRYANNNRQPSLERLVEIAKILKVSPRDLIVG
jgi:putative transcriptional regulator